MTPYKLTWHAVAERDLLNLPHWRLAARVAEAMEAFARDGSGQVERMSTLAYRLRVAGVVVLFAVDASARQINVWRVL